MRLKFTDKMIGRALNAVDEPCTMTVPGKAKLFEQTKRTHVMNRRQITNGSGRTYKRLFTLIELLVVITILSILAALLLPALGKAKNKARELSCTSSLKQIHLGTELYSDDFDGFYPKVYWSTSGYGAEATWQHELSSYFGVPAATPEERVLAAFGPGKFCCEAKLNSGMVTAAPEYGYAMNFLLGMSSKGPHSWNPAINKYIRKEQVTRPAGCLLVTESGLNEGVGVPQLDWYWILQPGGLGNNWHEGRGNNTLWCDGHVELFRQVVKLTIAPYAEASVWYPFSPY